jgi:predicted membrane-bound spermidine synthase
MRHLALYLSFSVGFLSLSQEIVWVRLVSFAQGGRPQAFSLVLAAFLVGIALGAIVGRRLCRNSPDLPRSAGLVLFVAGALDLLMLQLAPLILPYAPLPLALLVFAIALTAGLKGVLFPVVHHLGSLGATGRVGRSVSRIYLGNVMGSSLGPIVTGFWLLDRVDVETAMALIGFLTVALGVPALAFARRRPGIAWLAPAALLAFGAATVVRPPAVVVPLADSWGPDKEQIRHVIQNKHGIIHVLKPPRGQGGDITFGGNAYDGRINVDMSINSNELDRAYLMAVMHPAPRRALVVGLSTGAWTRVIEGMPGIESVKVIEINPGYLDLIRRYPEVAPLLSNPRVSIEIDDGRRWLRAHPEERFDLFFQNTTWHWRAYTTQLLSADYLREVKAHLRPGGIMASNATSSLDTYRTALEVFKHVVRYKGFVYMSDSPLAKRPDAEQVLRASTLGGRPAFDEALFAGDGIAARLVHDPLQGAHEFIAGAGQRGSAAIITDMNLLPEFAHGRPPLFGWLRPLLPPTPSQETN